MSERKDGMSEHQTIVHTGQAIGWYRCDGSECPICGMNNEASQKLQRDGMEREARRWLTNKDCRYQSETFCPHDVISLAALLEICANEARLEALEQAAAKVETMKFAYGDSWGCFMAPSHEAEELAAAIRALKAEPVPPPKPAREG